MVVGHTEAANLQLAWDASPSAVAGYRIYVGRIARGYDMMVDVGDQTSYSLAGLTRGRRYYFTITAYDRWGNESDFSNEVSVIPWRSDTGRPQLESGHAFGAGSGSMGSNGSGDEQFGAVGGTTWRPSGRLHGEASIFTAAADLPPEAGQEAVSNASTVADSSKAGVSSGSPEPALLSEWIELGDVKVDFQWQRVEFRKPFVDPVVVAKASSNQQAKPAAVQLRDVDNAGFAIRLRPWDDRDLTPTLETAGFLVIERGRYTLGDGIRVEAGVVEVDSSRALPRIAFGEGFSEVPVVITAMASAQDAEMVSVNPTMISEHGFEYHLQTSAMQESRDTPVSLTYVAWEPSSGGIDGLTFEVKKVERMSGDLSPAVWFEESFDAAPVFLADMQGPPGGALGVRWESKTPAAVVMTIDRDHTVGSIVTPSVPAIGYIAVRETPRDRP
jgi:hypothetical protein